MAFSPRTLDMNQFKSDDFTVESAMQFLACEHALKVVEVPITIHYTYAAKHHAQAAHGYSFQKKTNRNE
jgi:hypothetical protein